MFQKIFLLPTLLLAAVCLVACGKGDDNAPSTSAATNPTRGQLLSTPTVAGTYSTSDLLSMLTTDPLGKELLQLTFSPTCSITVYHMEYETVGGAGEATTASGALMVPSGSSSGCQGAHPVVEYAHGTNASKTFNMANLSGTSEALSWQRCLLRRVISSWRPTMPAMTHPRCHTIPISTPANSPRI